jgi:hypothetical protein
VVPVPARVGGWNTPTSGVSLTARQDVANVRERVRLPHAAREVDGQDIVLLLASNRGSGVKGLALVASTHAERVRILSATRSGLGTTVNSPWRGGTSPVIRRDHGMSSARTWRRKAFEMAQRLGEDVCVRCGKTIHTFDEFSMEHRVPRSVDPALVDEPTNIAWSHLTCNQRHGARLGGLSGWTDERRDEQAKRGAARLAARASLLDSAG